MSKLNWEDSFILKCTLTGAILQAINSTNYSDSRDKAPCCDQASPSLFCSPPPNRGKEGRNLALTERLQ